LKYKLECIDWVDSHGHSGWVEPEKKAKNCVIYSVGWVVSETKKNITITSHIDPMFNHYHAPMTIPKCSIIKRKRIKT